MFAVLYDTYITNTCACLNQPIITHYFSRMRRTRHGHITFIPSGTQLKVEEILRFNNEILSYNKDFFVDFSGVSDAGQLHSWRA